VHWEIQEDLKLQRDSVLEPWILIVKRRSWEL